VKDLHYNGDGHIWLTAPTRSGKTRDMLAAIALTYRGRGGAYVELSPHRQNGVARQGQNADCDGIAEGLVAT
jgi:hypothetical protein